MVQGIGAGIVTPQASGFIQALFRGAERGRAFGLLGASIGVSTAVGPVAGGAILDLVGGDGAWRWIFPVNLPLGLAVFVLGLRLLPVTETTSDSRLDPVGVVLLGAATILVLLPLIGEAEVDAGAGVAARPWWLLGAGLAVLLGFFGWERRHARRGGAPVVDLQLFRRRSYALGAAIALTYFAGFTAIFFVLTLALQSGLGYTPLQAGLVSTPFALGSAVGSAYGGRLVNRYGRVLVSFGLVLSIIGLVGAAVVANLVPGEGVGWAIAVPSLVAGLGGGFVISPNQALTLGEVPVSGGGSAAGVVQTGQRIGSALGIATVGAAFLTSLAGSGGDYLSALTIGLLVAVGFVAMALLVALLDLALSRRSGVRARL